MATTLRHAHSLPRAADSARAGDGGARYQPMAAGLLPLLERGLRYCVLPTASAIIMANELRRRLVQTKRRSAQDTPPDTGVDAQS